MIAVNQLVKCFEERLAVDAVSFRVSPGELFALLGPNGAGKTTTLNCLLGFLAPDGGNTEIAGIDVAARTHEARKHLAYIPEQVGLYGNFTALENIEYFGALSGKAHSQADLRAFLADAGIDSPNQDRRVATFSKGMRQKVAIAITLAKNAEALLLDEPTSGLDPSAAYEFSRLLHTLRERGVAIVMATHDLFRAREDATHIGIMRHGRLARTLSASEIGHADLQALYLEVMHE
jgi:ABC-2 type transport system ATP-binding protein